MNCKNTSTAKQQLLQYTNHPGEGGGVKTAGWETCDTQLGRRQLSYYKAVISSHFLLGDNKKKQ